jgi:hypothetical protein
MTITRKSETKPKDELSTQRLISYGLMVFCLSVFMPLIVHSIVTLSSY